MVIEEINIKNFKALKNIDLKNLPALAVFVGKNGVGKTTLFRVFAFLKNCLSNNAGSPCNTKAASMASRKSLPAVWITRIPSLLS